MDTTTTYRRRDNAGVKHTDVRAGTWAAQVSEFAPSEALPGGFTTVSVFGDRLHSEQAEITVSSFPEGPKPFFAVHIGGACAVTLYLSPAQVAVLGDALWTAAL